MAAPQTLKNHMKLDTLHHFIITPILLLNFGFSFVLDHNYRQQHPHIAAWWVVLSFCFLLLSVKTRLYALRNQDRLIRLEERLRLTALLPPAEHPSIQTLSTSQLIALRFASDAELPALARRTLAEGLTSRQIKESITTWRPDYLRV